jgi:hypothetical protein
MILQLAEFDGKKPAKTATAAVKAVIVGIS